MQPLLEIETLHAGYGDADVLHGISLHVLPGEIVAIVGPNGAGKSTVLNAVMNLLQIRKGEIRFQGGSIQNRETERQVIREESLYVKMRLSEKALRSRGITILIKILRI